MKLITLCLGAHLASASVRHGTLRGAQQLLAVDLRHDTTAAGKPELMYGKPGCPCVGIDGVPGSKSIDFFNPNVSVSYPADVGSHCQDWEHGRHPSCLEDDPPEWCSQQWCWVNPCHCNLPVPPKATQWNDFTHQGMPVYFSYDTCGYDNSWTKEMAKEACPNRETEEECRENPDCDWIGQCLPIVLTKVCSAYVKRGGPPEDWGKTGCPCVGIKGFEGSFTSTFGEGNITIPADSGSKCEAWYPKFDGFECEGDYCEDKWCWVDPCNCDTGAEKAKFLPDSNVQGKPLFYSFATCGNADRASSSLFKKELACSLIEDEAGCTANGDVCSWYEDRCVDSIVPDICKAAKKELETRMIHPVEIIGGDDAEIHAPTSTTTPVNAANRTAEEVREYREFSR